MIRVVVVEWGKWMLETQNEDINNDTKLKKKDTKLIINITGTG